MARKLRHARNFVNTNGVNTYALRVNDCCIETCAYNALAMASRSRERISANLKRLLKQHPDFRSQTALAERAGLAIASVNGAYNAKRGLKLDTIDRIARALGVDVVDLFAPEGSDRGRHSGTQASAGDTPQPSEARLLETNRLAAITSLQRITDHATRALFALGYEPETDNAPQASSSGGDRPSETHRRPARAR
jgi:transcriptional regulator with XRE-family HTH domain